MEFRQEQLSEKFVPLILVGAVLIVIGVFLNSPRVLCLFIPVMLTAWFALGTINKRQIPRGLKYTLLVFFAIYEVALNAMLSLDNSVLQPTFLGLPIGSAIMIYLLYLTLFAVTVIPFSRFYESWVDEEKGEAIIQKYAQMHKEEI